ncbi:MAG: hypothetical protein HGA53_06975, partial [Anaerolineaceae bacterium]|nr:hypothetical protein [Anaerolineaceae bacterium]
GDEIGDGRSERDGESGLLPLLGHHAQAVFPGAMQVDDPGGLVTKDAGQVGGLVHKHKEFQYGARGGKLDGLFV